MFRSGQARILPQLKTSKYCVAYLDVLGAKKFMADSSDKFLNDLNSIYFDAKNEVESTGRITSEAIEAKIFSDNILICYKKTTSSISAFFLVSFLRLIATIQRIFFEGYHLIVRGGITKGPLYLTNDFVGGKALIDAVELESTTIYPRIVVADCILSELNPKIQNDFLKKFIETPCQDLLVKSTDDKFFLNYIISYNPWIMFPKEDSQSESIESFEELEKLNREGRLRLPIYNPESLKEIYVILKKHKDFVENKVIEFSQSSNDEIEEAKRLKILKKYLWLVSFHNKICDHVLYKMPQLKISLKSEFNEQTLAFDVSVG